jgi:hypothetical protein
MNWPGETISLQRPPGGWFHLDGETVLRAVPDLELVLGEVRPAVADDVPLDLSHQLACRDRARRVHASEDEADVLLALAPFLAGVPGGDADAATRLCQRRVEPAGDRARVVMRVAVGAEADVDRNGQAQLLGDREQVVDGMGKPGRVVERLAALYLVGGDGDQDGGELRASTDPAIAGGNAGYMGGVGADAHLRLRL